ncbi:MAG: hypothetical protein IPM92_13165 [Saprospiraceae bacterium]|nr:hypothetical protein [Saprospiraceae bacterium]
MIRSSNFFILAFIFSFGLNAQMTFKGNEIYGNEWHKPNQKYWKLNIPADGIYKISYSMLQQSGFPVATIPASHMRLYKFGEQKPMIRSTTGLMGSDDYLLIYGLKNRAELDEALFQQADLLMNPEYSMFNDTSVYFLTYDIDPDPLDVTFVLNDLSAPLPKDEYYIQNKKLIFSEISFKRSTGFGSDQKYPLFDNAQGYTSDIFRNRNFNLNFDNYYSDGPDAQILIRITGYGDDNTAHRPAFTVDGVSFGTEIFAGYKIRTKEILIPAFELKNEFTLNINGEASPEDKLAVSLIELNYPRKFDFNQQRMAHLKIGKSLIRKYLELENFDGGTEIVIYDITNNIYLKSIRETNGVYRITIPPSSNDREFVIWNPAEEKPISGLHETEIKSFNSGNFNYVILYHPKLESPVNGINYVQEYARYRSSAEGGSYKVALVNIEELYDAFAFGIHTHSLAVKNFSQYVRTIWPDMKYFLILGKGLEYPYYRQSGLNTDYFLVPTFCSPASDISLVCDQQNKPFCAFGRLPVINGSEIKAYLDKIKSHEAFTTTSSYNLENREWLKRVIHLSGGDPQIYALISSQLAGMENVIESNLSGADVKTFYKQSSNTIEVANSELLRKYINEGSAIISFMGHSAAIRLDFNLENVDSYMNKDRYHLFMAMGCYAGSLFANNRSISEDHNLAPERGSIVYVANTTAGYPDILGIFGNEFYRQLGGKKYGKSTGEALQETILQMISNGGERLLTQAYSVTFNGDPAVKLNFNEAQDYTLDSRSLSTEPSLVFSTQKEFELRFEVVSLGAYEKDSIQLTVERELPNGSRRIVFDQQIAKPSWRSQISMLLPVSGDTAVGYNRLYIKLDGKNLVQEGPLPEAENNNDLEVNGQMGYSFFVFGNEAKPVYPKEFAIIQSNSPQLIACNGNTLAEEIDYYFELDTTEYFNSSHKQSHVVKQTGGVIHWTPSQSLMENVAYYWRVSPDSIGAGQFAWRNSSFIYLPGSTPGWNQSHFFQHKKNDLYKMQLNEPDRQFQYSAAYVEIRANNGYIELPSFIRPRLYVGTDVSSDYDYWNYNNNFSGVVVNVFNPISGRLWVNVTGGDFNSYQDGRYGGKPFYIFQTETAQQRAILMDFLENSIPVDHVVVLSTLSQYQNSYFPELWEADGVRNMFSVLESFGAKQVRSLKSFNSVPYILVYRKGRSDFEVKESIGNFTDENEISHIFSIPQTEGSMQSRIIGPAKAWSQFSWNYNLFNAAEDQQEINIYGISPNGNQTLLRGPFTDAVQDLSNIQTRDYPQLMLEWKSKDTSSRSSSVLDYWRVTHVSLPDAAFHPALWFKKSNDTINQGDPFDIEILAQNIGEADFDSLLVKFTLVSQTNQQTISYKRLLPLASLTTLKIPFSFNTSSVYGSYKLFIELNPDSDQAELYSFNNTAVIPFFIRRDRRQPYMDVTFDRNRIINLDIVSSKAVIEISIQDENKDLLLNDTSVLEMRLKEPGGNPQRIYFSQNNVEFVPAAGAENKLKAIIHGRFTKDGIYTLYVKGYDASGNPASDLDYIIDFTIITKSSVSNFVNYPNPFSSRTRFVYTLTGDEIPEYYSIQIMTVSGKVVREISKEEIGALQIGTHMTEFEYDGTDQFGEKLANGVYLYRFRVKDRQKKAIEKYDNGTDQFFTKEFGKMLILR